MVEITPSCSRHANRQRRHGKPPAHRDQTSRSQPPQLHGIHHHCQSTNSRRASIKLFWDLIRATPTQNKHHMYQNHPPTENVDKPSSRYHPPPQPFTTQESQPPSPEKKAKTLETKAGRPSRVTTRRRRQNRPTTEEKVCRRKQKPIWKLSYLYSLWKIKFGNKESNEKILSLKERRESPESPFTYIIFSASNFVKIK